MLSGLEWSDVRSSVDLHLHDPATCARLLLDGEVDVALCPVGALLEVPSFEIASEYGIGCLGSVRTVSVYSDLPFNELQAISLYSESRTSNLLVQVLEKYHWKQGRRFIADGKRTDLPAGQLVIGDRCFEYESRFAHVQDLGAAWHEMTGLPFVFAVWASLKPVDKELWKSIDQAFAYGIENIDRIPIPAHMAHIGIDHYLKKNIRYQVDEDARTGLRKFIDLAAQLDNESPNALQIASGKSLDPHSRDDHVAVAK